MKHVYFIQDRFELFGRFIFENRWIFAIVCFLISGVFGLGLLSLSLNNDIEELFLNNYSPTRSKEEQLNKLFPDKSGDNFKAYSSVKGPLFVEIIVSDKGGENMLEPRLLNETYNLIDSIKNITITSDHLLEMFYVDVCAKNSSNCVIVGEEILQELNHCKDKKYCFLSIDRLQLKFSKERCSQILNNIGKYTLVNNTITSAKYLKFRFYLRQDSQGFYHDSKKWQSGFLKYMVDVNSDQIDITYRHSTSFYEELGQDTYPDIRFYALTFTVILTFFGFYISGGDCVSRRVHIGRMGTIVVPLSVLGAWGLICGTGTEFTNTIGVMPYFAIFHAVNNMLVTFNAVSEQPDTACAKVRVSNALKIVGIPITITSITNVIVFAVGTRSEYKAMQLFSKFTVGTLIFMYINHMVFFTACLAIHEKRIDDNRHFCTCNTVKPKRDVENGRSCCFLCCCTGEKPTSRDGTSSTIEHFSRKLLSLFVLKPYVRWPSLLLFLTYIGVALWKTISFKAGVFQVEYVTKDSYFRKFEDINSRVFEFNFYVTFVLPGHMLYQDQTALHDVLSIENKITANKYIDTTSLISWLSEYTNSTQGSTSNSRTVSNHIASFLSTNPKYKDDIAISSDGKIISSRFYVKTQNIHSPEDAILLKMSLLKIEEISDDQDKLQEELMMSQKARSLNSSSDDVDEMENFITLYAPTFIYTDKYTSPLIESIVLISTLVGVALVLLMIVCPHPLSFINTLVWFASIEIGLFGFMSMFHIVMTPFSMIITVLVSCYAVDVVTHSMYAFFNTVGTDRPSRVHELLSSTFVTLFITTLGSFLGQLVLFVEKSYVFLTVMKIVMIATAVCCLHAALFLPILLSFFGPKDENRPKDDKAMGTLKKIVIPQLHNGTTNQMNQPHFEISKEFNKFNKNNDTRILQTDASYDNKAYREDDVLSEKL